MNAVASVTASAGTDALDPRLLKAQFPIFSTPRAKPLIYLDSAARQKPQAVLDAMDLFYATQWNIHRGKSTAREQATALYEDARRRFAAFRTLPARDRVHATPPRH
jgi:cysteine desulfurase/selenocysteine lyase